MTFSIRKYLLSSVMLAAGAYAGNSLPSAFELSGTATFEAPTSMPGIEVKGTSNAVAGHLSMARDDRGLALEHVDVAIPVKSLATGMKVRDEHMRKYIFTDAQRQLPDIRFAADSAFCTVSPSSQEFPCEVSGVLSIRGTAHAFSVKLYVRQQSGSRPAFRAVGDALVKLSDYGITRPSQFGVSTSNEVKLHLDFSAKQGNPTTTAVGAER